MRLGGESKPTRTPRADAAAADLYVRIFRVVESMSVGQRFAVFGAFKRGDGWADLDDEIQDKFREFAT